MKRIVTHDGKSHFDELFAIGILLEMEYGEDSSSELPDIERRNPTDEELDDPEVAVVDIGGEYAPSKYNFDHHHDESLPASFRLVAQNYRIEAGGLDQILRDGHRWYEYKDLLDRKGPSHAAHAMGVHGDTKPLRSPVESSMVRRFREDSTPNLLVAALFREMARDWIDRAVTVSKKIEEFRDEGEVEHFGDLGVFVIDQEPDSYVIEQLRNKESLDDFDATITKSPREEGGWTAFRYPDVNLDFQEAAFKVFPAEEVQFAHNSGFLAVMQEKEDIRKVIRKAGFLSDAYSCPIRT